MAGRYRCGIRDSTPGRRVLGPRPLRGTRHDGSVLAGMHDRYGTFDEYFATLGLTATIAALRVALLEP